jgi:hypothetical protein
MTRTPPSALRPVFAAFLALSACETATPVSTVEEADPLVRLSPRTGGLGMTVTLRLRGVNTQWTEGSVSVDLGPDILVAGVTVLGPNTATADVSIPEVATLGYRDVAVSFPGVAGATQHFILEDDDGFLVEPGGIAIAPDRARLGETLQVDVVGYNTIFQDGSTWADLGEGVYVNWVAVQDQTHATVSVSVDQRADPGWHDMVMFNGPTGYTLMDGFFIDRSSVAIEIDPDHGNQGEVLPFVVIGHNTHFEETGSEGAIGERQTFIDLSSSICVNEYWPDCQDPVEPGGPVSVNSPSAVSGDMRISNGAEPGFYDVRALTVERQDLDEDGVAEPGEWVILEEIILHDGFEVRPVPIDCNDNPGVGFGFSVSRDINNETCEVAERVSAYAVFYTPLDPPCGNPPMDPVFPYDIDYIRLPPGGADCPATPTCDAGPYVYLESEQNVITLARQINPYTGEISYGPEQPLTLDDYKFGYVAYDLRAEGSDDPTQIPAFTAEDVLYTLPSDFELLEPFPCQNFTHDPNEDMQVYWTPAQTYDVAGLTLAYQTADEEGQAWMLITIPWDDGDHLWAKENFQQLPEGGGYFVLAAGVGEPKWFLDFGNGPVGLENQGDSGLSWRGFMLLRSAETEEEGQ